MCAASATCIADDYRGLEVHQHGGQLSGAAPGMGEGGGCGGAGGRACNTVARVVCGQGGGARMGK
jgi:hypothetical protein